MSAAHVRRGGVARAKPRKPSKVAVPKRIAKKLPVDQARANKLAGLVFAAFMLAIGWSCWSRSTFRPRPSARPAPRSARPGFTVSGYQIVGINHMDRVARSMASSMTS